MQVKIKCEYERLTADENGVCSLSFKIMNSAKAREISAQIKALQGEDKRLTLAVDKYRNNRSLNANSYMWELLGKLSDALNISPERLYKNFVKESGVYQILCIHKAAFEEFSRLWNSHGIGWFVEKIDEEQDTFQVHAYAGSSTYDSNQMAKLIESIVMECKEQGIETMTPKELENIMKTYRGKSYD